jgi:callose synthase
MCSIMWKQRHLDHYWSTPANDRLITFLYVAAAFCVPEVLALVLFVVPWLRNFIENSSWRIFHVLTWWFQTRAYVGRGLREGVADNIKYTLFWLCILASKFAFSYFLQIRPLIAPTKQILRTTNVTYKWHEFIPDGTQLSFTHRMFFSFVLFDLT